MKPCEYRYNTDGFKHLFIFCNLDKKTHEDIVCIGCTVNSFIPIKADYVKIRQFRDGSSLKYEKITQYTEILR